jgi:hypothetical protein
MRVALRPERDDLAALTAEVAALRQRNAEHERRLAALEAVAPRDQADRVLGDVIIASTTGLPFRSHELLDHAATDAVLRAALLDVGLQTADEVGAWLRDRVGTRHGITVSRRRGRRWHVTTDTSDT